MGESQSIRHTFSEQNICWNIITASPIGQDLKTDIIQAIYFATYK